MALVEEHMSHRGITREDVSAFLFVGPDGDQLDYSNWLHRNWYPARKEADHSWLQFHDLRRANATGLVLEGVDIKTAQTRLGHTDPRLTLGIYAQATTEADRDAAIRLGRRFITRSMKDRNLGR
jgi:integrase